MQKYIDTLNQIYSNNKFCLDKLIGYPLDIVSNFFQEKGFKKNENGFEKGKRKILVRTYTNKEQQEIIIYIFWIKI